jgi:hypothetical protein
VVIKAIRERLETVGTIESPIPTDNRELVERYVELVVIKQDMIEVRLSDSTETRTLELHAAANNDRRADEISARTITLPWSGPALAEIKGILHSASSHPTMSMDARDLLLTAIAKARSWIDDLVEGRVASFDEIAKREGKVVRYVRLLAPLAFVSPRVISAIIAGSAPVDLTVTRLAQTTPYSWTVQAGGTSLT